jgi:hypothetical protein
MRTIKILLAVLMVQLIVSCGSKSAPQPSLAGKWNITSALGNDGRHWTGSFTLKQEGGENKYTGLFLWRIQCKYKSAYHEICDHKRQYRKRFVHHGRNG